MSATHGDHDHDHDHDHHDHSHDHAHPHAAIEDHDTFTEFHLLEQALRELLIETGVLSAADIQRRRSVAVLWPKPGLIRRFASACCATPSQPSQLWVSMSATRLNCWCWKTDRASTTLSFARFVLAIPG